MTDQVEVGSGSGNPGSGGGGGHPGYSPWPNVRIILALLVVALVCMIGSFLVPGQTTKVVRTSRVAPISTSLGQVQTIHLPQSYAKNASYDVNLQFHFNIATLKTAETIFHVGSPKYGISASISEPIEGQRYVVLSAANFSAVLVNHVVVGETYAARISIDGGTSITAWLDGQQQFSYQYLPLSLVPYLKSVTVGGPLPIAQHGKVRSPSSHSAPKPSPLLGAVSGFNFSSRELVPVGSDTHISALRVLAGLAVFLALVLLALRIATSRMVSRGLGISEEEKVESRSWWRWTLEHGTFLGIALLVGGVAILAIVTPLDNMVVQQSGVQNFAASDVGPNQKTTYALFGEPTVFTRATALDVHLAFQMRLDGPVARQSGKYPVVSTFSGNQGIQFTVHRAPKSPYVTSLIQSNSLLEAPEPLLYTFPPHTWITTTVDIDRSQSAVYKVEGKQVYSFTWNLPVLYPSPGKLTVDGAFGGSVRNVSMTVTLYRQQPSRIPYLLIRLAQGLGITALVGAAILLSRRFISNLIPPATQARRPLVLTTFWTMGVGIAINVVVNLFHFQASNLLQLGRNTWLYPPGSRFSDFFQPYELLHSLNPYNIQLGSYPPLGYWLVAPVAWMNEYAALFTFLSLTIGILIWWFWRSFTVGMHTWNRVLVVVIAFFSLPLSFAIDRANIDLIVFLAIIFGMAFFEQNRGRAAAIWIGLAAAVKIYPILYLFVFLHRRRYKYIAYGVLVAGIVSLLGFASFGLHSIDGFRSAISSLQSEYSITITGRSILFNASALGWAQGIAWAVGGVSGAHRVYETLEPLVLPAEVLGALVLAWYLRWREKSLWRGVTLITVLFILFNTVSYYYDLMFLFIPLALFAKEASVNRRGLVVAVLFGLVLAPRAYFYLQGTDIDASVLTTAPLLAALAVAVIYDGHRERAERVSIASGAISSENPEVGTTTRNSEEVRA